MALTQTARIPGPGPSWDEQVVPALRKRLESESRTLARRISAISMSSAEAADDYSNATSPFQYTSTPTPLPIATTANRKPNQHHQSSSTSSRPGSRSRTHSQPANVNNVNRASSSSHPTLPPNQSSKTTQSRIPLPQRTRSRTGSLSSQNHTQNRTKTPTQGDPGPPPPPPPPPPPDLWVVHERPSHSRLVNEPAPFPPPNSSVSSLDGLPEPRPSNESEERPYEHWYRGEVSRNGGVGEYRVAKRQEMLEIANYGHSIRPKKQNAITEAVNLERQRKGRPRAGSLGDRTSFYLDEEQAKEAARVMDENPLTDNGEEDDDGEEEYYDPMEYYYHPEELPPRNITPRPSRIPTSTQMLRGQSEPPYFPSSSAGASTSALSSSPATPKQRPSVSNNGTGTPQSKRAGATSPPSALNKGKAKASGSTTPSPSSNSRLAASKATQAKLAQNKRQREKEEEYRRSIAAYPDPGDDLMNAIPTWTQPVPKAGNWDDVVLPVVARKKGLDGHYERADGSPQQRKDETIAPAPGTFGYNHSKYRPPRDGGENIPMDEFGAKNSSQDSEEKDEDEDQPPRPQSRMETAHDQIRLPTNTTLTSKRSSSPVPFSSYKVKPSQPEPVGQMGQMDSDVEKGKVQRVEIDDSEDAGKGGCCGCVVM